MKGKKYKDGKKTEKITKHFLDSEVQSNLPAAYRQPHKIMD